MKKITVKQITVTAVMLAVCILSQFFKNASVYITGPIINAALILVTLSCGPVCGFILSVITPITAYFITGSPVMAAIPLMFPAIMLGNAVLVCSVWLFGKMIKKKVVSEAVSMVLGALLKGLFMGLVIALWILPTFLPEKMLPKLPILQTQFSITQAITALIGCVYAFAIIQIPYVKRFIKEM